MLPNQIPRPVIRETKDKMILGLRGAGWRVHAEENSNSGCERLTFTARAFAVSTGQSADE